MSFGLYSIGYAIVIGGLIYAAYLIHMPKNQPNKSRPRNQAQRKPLNSSGYCASPGRCKRYERYLATHASTTTRLRQTK